MSDDSNTKPGPGGPKVLTREEARKKREYYLALAAENEKRDREAGDPDATEPTVATMILPGD